jgi:hypothetical protein
MSILASGLNPRDHILVMTTRDDYVGAGTLEVADGWWNKMAEEKYYSP